MKTTPFKLMAALAMGAVLMMAFQCGKDDDQEPVNPNYNARHSECKNTPDDANYHDTVSVAYDASAQRLHVVHHNLMVNCGIAQSDGGIIVTAVRDGQTIHIYEREDESFPQADCMCDVDNEFDLHNIEPGTYTLVFHSCYPEPRSFTFTF